MWQQVEPDVGGGGLRYASNSETDRNMEAGQLESYLSLTILGFLALADYHHLQPPISLEKQQSLLVQCTCIQFRTRISAGTPIYLSYV